MLRTQHFWSNPKCQKNAHCFLLLYLYLKSFENSSLALIQFNTKKHEVYFYSQFGKSISVETKYIQFFTLKPILIEKTPLKFMFTDADLMFISYDESLLLLHINFGQLAATSL